MLSVDQYLRTEARHVLAVYGAWDAWTGGKITVDPLRGNLTVEVPSHTHDAQLSMLPETEQSQAIDLLHSWMRREFVGTGDHRRTSDRPELSGASQRRISAMVLERERDLRSKTRLRSMLRSRR